MNFSRKNKPCKRPAMLVISKWHIDCCTDEERKDKREKERAS